MDAFNAQEGQHYRQHMRFNEALRIAGVSGLAEHEAKLEADYRRFSETKSLQWNLAYAEGFEAYTSALARYFFDNGMLDRLRPDVRELYTWHLVEELEHRTVAFDVYEHVCGAYAYRVVVALYAQWHLNQFVIRAAHLIRDAEPLFHAKYGSKAQARARVWKLTLPTITGLLPKVLGTYLPWYSPRNVKMPTKFDALAARYDAMAAELADEK
jgi:predicted metal-dependent hydrolase